MKLGLNIRRNVTTTVAAFFVNIALTFIGYRLVVQQGGTHALGLWASLSAAIYIIRLGDVGMSSAAERHIAALDASQFPDKVRGYLDTAFVMNAILFTLLATVGWTLLTWKIDWVVPDDSSSQAEAVAILPLMLAGLVLSNLSAVVTGGLRGLHVAYQAAYLSVVGGLLQVAIVLLLVPSMGITGLAWGQFLQHAFTVVVAWIMFIHQIEQHAKERVLPFPIKSSIPLLRDLFGFSLKAQAVNLTNGLLEPISKLIVGNTAGISALGLYEMAYKIVALPRNAVVSGVMGMMPAITRLHLTDPKQAERLYKRSRYMVTLCAGIMMTLIIIASPLISYTFLETIDKDLIVFIVIMALAFWLNSIGAPAYTIGFAVGRLGGNMISAILSLVCLVVLSGVFYKISPQYGSLVASAIALSFGGVFIVWRNERLLTSR